MIVTVDRVEGLVAVLELPDGTTRTIPVTGLPEGAKEGSKLEVTENGYILRGDIEEDERNRILEKMAKLKKKMK